MFCASKKSAREFLAALLPLLGLELSIGIPFIVIFVFLGSFGDPIPIAIYGLTNFLLNIVVFPMIFAGIETAGVIFSIEYAAKRYEEVIKVFYQSLLTFAVFMVLCYIFALFSESILILSHVEPNIAKQAAYLFQWTVIFRVITVVNRLIQVYMSAQGKAGEFLTINYISMILGTGLSFLFIIEFDMKQFGVVPASFIQESVTAIYCLVVFFGKADKRTLSWPRWSRIFAGYLSLLKRIGTNVIGTFIEWLTYEVNTFLAVQFHDVNELAVYLAWTGVSPIFYIIGFGLSGAIRVVIGKLIGEGRKSEARSELMAICFYIFILSVICGVFVFAFKNQIAWLFIQNKDLAKQLAEANAILAISQWGYLMIYPVFMMFRLFGREWYFVLIMGTYFLFSNTAIAISLGFTLEMKTLGLLIGHGVSTITTNLILLRKVFYGMNFDEIHAEIEDEADGLENKEGLID